VSRGGSHVPPVRDLHWRITEWSHPINYLVVIDVRWVTPPIDSLVATNYRRLFAGIRSADNHHIRRSAVNDCVPQFSHRSVSRGGSPASAGEGWAIGCDQYGAPDVMSQYFTRRTFATAHPNLMAACWGDTAQHRRIPPIAWGHPKGKCSWP
jgi:hypothetical protein